MSSSNNIKVGKTLPGSQKVSLQLSVQLQLQDALTHFLVQDLVVSPETSLCHTSMEDPTFRQLFLTSVWIHFLTEFTTYKHLVGGGASAVPHSCLVDS